MKTLDLIYEFIAFGVASLFAIPAFSKYGWKAFGLFFGEI